MVLNWYHSWLDLYWIQSGVNLIPEFLQCMHENMSKYVDTVTLFFQKLEPKVIDT